MGITFALIKPNGFTLPEYDTVLSMHGVGKTLAPQLIAEIGDIRNFPKRSSPARFAGIEPPENQ